MFHLCRGFVNFPRAALFAGLANTANDDGHVCLPAYDLHNANAGFAAAKVPAVVAVVVSMSRKRLLCPRGGLWTGSGGAPDLFALL